MKNLVFLSLPIFATFFYVGSWIKSFAVGFFAREFLTVISGENILSKTYLFHGRVGRWVRHLNLFDQEGSFNQFLEALVQNTHI